MNLAHVLEYIQFIVCFAIIGAILNTSKEKLYRELGWNQFNFGSETKKYEHFMK